MEVASKVSLVARVPEVRTKLVAIQQRMAEAGGVVVMAATLAPWSFPKRN